VQAAAPGNSKVVKLNAIRIALLVAQDEMARRSLEFVIQAEGIFVDSHQLLSSAMKSPFLKEADCAVVDEDAVNTPQAALKYLNRLPTPIILLAERPERHDAILRAVPIHILAKPLPGGILIDTLRTLRAVSGH
jgi:diketogulonate reductase-like aldo/keto reductase